MKNDLNFWWLKSGNCIGFESIDTLCMCNMLLCTLRLKTLSLMWEQSGKTPPISIARQSIGELYLKIKLTQTGKDIYLCQKRYI